MYLAIFFLKLKPSNFKENIGSSISCITAKNKTEITYNQKLVKIYTWRPIIARTNLNGTASNQSLRITNL